MRNALLALALLAHAAAPVALAQEEPKERPDDAAWVEDCPPDTMCAASANGTEADETSTDEPTRGPADGSCENCRGGDQPMPHGPEDCIECSGPAPTDSGTCMDGSAPEGRCDPDVRYLGGGSEPSSDASHAPAGAEADPTPAKDVPAAAFALLIVGAGIAVILLGRRR